MKPCVREAIIVEGRYDRAAVARAVDAVILETSGFGIFSDTEKLDLIRRIAVKRGVILLTDSDGAGLVIRGYLKGALPADLVKEAYIPDIVGKERRKRVPSREGKLGVEGMSSEVILQSLRRAGATFEGEESARKDVRLGKADLYAMGLTGTRDASEKRRELLKHLSLPENLSTGALLDVLNALDYRLSP